MFYGGVSGVGSLTVGDGDAGGFTDGGDKKISLESLYGGWRSGALWPNPWARMRSTCRRAVRTSTSATAF